MCIPQVLNDESQCKCWAWQENGARSRVDSSQAKCHGRCLYTERATHERFSDSGVRKEAKLDLPPDDVGGNYRMSACYGKEEGYGWTGRAR